MKRFIENPSKGETVMMLHILKEFSATASQLAKTLDKPRTSLNYHLLNLEYSGFLKSERDGRNTFFRLTAKGEAYLKSIIRSGDLQKRIHLPPHMTTSLARSDEGFDRFHCIYIKSPIVKMPKEEDLLKLGFQKGVKMKNWGQQFYGLRMEHCSVQITPRHFLFFLDEIVDKSAHVATLIAFEQVADAIEKLEEVLPGLSLGEPERLAQFVRQHHALQDDFLAHRCRGEGLIIRTDRFGIDSSKGKPEIEFTDPELAAEDFESYIKAKQEAGPEGYIELVEETIKGRFSPRAVNDAVEKLTDISKDVKETLRETTEILERLVPPKTLPPREPEEGMFG